MDTKQSMTEAHDALNSLYQEHLSSVLSVQRTFLSDILPALVDEFAWDDTMARWARSWLEDTGFIFRMFKRHRYTVSFTLEALRITLLWRVASLATLRDPGPVTHSFLSCISPPASDFLHRPVLVLSLAEIDTKISSQTFRSSILVMLERLRIHLQKISEELQAEIPVLQYVLVVSVTNVSLDNSKLDLLRWFIRQAQPQFPGMLAAVHVVNYSWTQSATWNLVKHILPKTVLSRVFFPPKKELLEVISPSSLPDDYGGSLPPISSIPDQLSYIELSSPLAPSEESGPPSGQPIQRLPQPELIRRPPHITSRSSFNPFFGYPVISLPKSSDNVDGYFNGYNVPNLRHGRRRKRDLARTLLRLWWERWRSEIKTAAWIVAIVAALWMRRSPIWKQRWSALPELARKR